jgi:hypothetical protein
MRVRIPEGIETIVEARLFLWSLYRSMDVDNHRLLLEGGWLYIISARLYSA